MDRYIRNKQLSGLGTEGQTALSRARVLVIGAGALGSVSSMYLAASGVGYLTIADFDNVDITNLQRQLSYSEADTGKPKAEALARKIAQINSEIKVRPINALITKQTLEPLMTDADIVIEASDNPTTKYMVTECAERLGKPYALGAVAQWRGQAMSWCPGHAGYRDLFPVGADERGYTPCSVGGILGPLPGIIGSIQASEAIKLITGAGEPLLGRLLLVDALAMTTRVVAFE